MKEQVVRLKHKTRMSEARLNFITFEFADKQAIGYDSENFDCVYLIYVCMNAVVYVWHPSISACGKLNSIVSEKSQACV